MENNEVMNEELVVTDYDTEVVETEKKDNSGAVGFALGSLLTLGVIAGVKGVKKLVKKAKAKKASKVSAEVEDEGDGNESDE